MKEVPFRLWLKVERGLSAGTVSSRISNCRRVERHECDLDAHYDSDKLDGLLQRLNPGEPEHGIPIAGDVYNGTATLKNAVSLYCDFRKGGSRNGFFGGQSGKATAATGAESAIASTMARLGRNRRTRISSNSSGRWRRSCGFSIRELSAPWSKITGASGAGGPPPWKALGIDPAIYLWEGSPCAFPGVRRYAGSTEIAVFRKRAKSSEAPPQCLSLDDNDYPKHLWSFVFTSRPFRKRGPAGYQLAHLFDHKEYGNRWRDELDTPPGVEEPVLPYGLFTSAANAVYAPGAFLRPTDLSPRLRSLIQRWAHQLYGDVLLSGAAAPGGKALRRPGLGRRQIPVERACGWHGARSRFPGIPPRAHRRTHRKAERGATGRRRPLSRRNQQVVTRWLRRRSGAPGCRGRAACIHG